MRKRIFFSIIAIFTLLFLNGLFDSESFAADHTSGCSPGAPCYCYPVTVSETKQACSNGQPSSVYVQWDASNCLYCNFGLSYTDNSGGHTISPSNGCAGYSTSHTTINGTNLHGNVNVWAAGTSGQVTAVGIINTCPTNTPTPTNTPIPTPTNTPTPTPTPTNTPTPTPTPTNTPTPTPTPITSAQHPYCDATGNINNLTFGINNTTGWTQYFCGDTNYVDLTSDSLPPPGSTCGGVTNSYAMVTDSSCINPGMFFSGTNPDFGNGSVSSTNWEVPNYAGQNGLLPTSWQFLTDTAQINGITVNDLNGAFGEPLTCGDYSNCLLDTNLKSGVYKVNTNNNTNPLKIGNSTTNISLGTSATPRNYIFLVDGDMYINGNIFVPAGSTATFSVKGNIYVDKSVGESDTTSQVGNIQGFYSSDHNFYAQGAQSINGGIPQTNQAQNPSFETGNPPSNWGLNLTPPGTAATAIQDSSAATDGSHSEKINITQVDGTYWHINLWQGPYSWVVGNSYTIQFDAKSDAPNNWMTAKSQHSNPYTAWFETPHLNLSKSWKTFTYTYTPTTTDLDSGFYFFVGNAVGNVWIDNVKVTSNTQLSRVQNNSFETNPLNPWYFNTNPPDAIGSLTQECNTTNHTDGICAAHIVTSTVNQPQNYWWVNMGQNGIPIFNGNTYTIQFDARATANRNIWVYLQDGSSPWTSYGEFHPALTPNWTSYSYTFTSQYTDTDAHLYFETGEATGDVWIDNVDVAFTAPPQYCNADATALDRRLNITGSVVVSASGANQGTFVNQRELCNNDNCPAIAITTGGGGTGGTTGGSGGSLGNGLTYILNAPAFLKRRTHQWLEVAPKQNAPTATPTP